jgi:hypothetical protein
VDGAGHGIAGKSLRLSMADLACVANGEVAWPAEGLGRLPVLTAMRETVQVTDQARGCSAGLLQRARRRR